MDCTLLNLYNCKELSVAGIKRVWVVEYKELYNFKYDNNDYSKITSFNANTLPIEYNIITGSFTSDLVISDTVLYSQKLSINIPKMDNISRENRIPKMVYDITNLLINIPNN